MTSPASLAGAFKALGAGFAIDPAAAAVTLTLADPARALEARELFYRALNGLEPHFSVFIEGLPFCFMPDAWDHVLYRRRAGRAYKAVRQCGSCALRGFCPGLEKNGVFNGKLRGELSPVLPVPKEIVFELTKRCNLACRCCFSDRSIMEPALEKLDAQLRKAAALGVRDIRFTGGEPFLSPHLLPLLKTAKKLGCYTLVNTNACAPSGLYAAAAPFMDNVLVSLQGRDQASDRAATGKAGLFRLKLTNMRLLRSTVPVFRIGTVASRNLLKNFTAYHALAARLKADVWEIYRPMLGHNAAAAGPEFDLGPADLAGLSARAAALKPGGPRVLLANPLPLCLVPEAERKNLLGGAFDDGHTRLVYDPRGFFKPSYYIAEELGGEIKKAWRSGYMKNLRSFYRRPGSCRNCRYLLKCLGGSRAMAMASGGDHFGNDPWLPEKPVK